MYFSDQLERYWGN